MIGLANTFSNRFISIFILAIFVGSAVQAPIKTANPTQMAGDAKNYQVTISHTVVDGLINILTGGLYTPTTTIVKK